MMEFNFDLFNQLTFIFKCLLTVTESNFKPLAIKKIINRESQIPPYHLDALNPSHETNTAKHNCSMQTYKPEIF